MYTPTVTYRHVTLDGTRLRGEFTAAGTAAFPHGQWYPVDLALDEWWVRLATADDATADACAELLAVDRDQVARAYRAAGTDTRRAVRSTARTATGDLLPASVLGMPPDVLTAALGDPD